MRFRKAIYTLTSWLLSTSLFAAACALALTLATEKLLRGHLLPVFSSLHLLVVGCTLAEYNVHYLLHAHGLLTNTRSGGDAYPRIWHLLLCVAGGILCLIALPSLPHRMIAAIAACGVLALLYSAPSLPFRPKRSINDYGITKITVLTGTWVVVTAVFPAMYLGLPWNAAGLELLWRALLIFPLCLAFDLRDLVADKQHGIQTLAGALGLTLSYRIIYCMLAVLTAVAAVQYLLIQPSPYRFYAICFSAIAAAAAVFCSQKRPHPFVYSGLIDGVMLLYGLLMIK